MCSAYVNAPQFLRFMAKMRGEISCKRQAQGLYIEMNTSGNFRPFALWVVLERRKTTTLADIKLSVGGDSERNR